MEATYAAKAFNLKFGRIKRAAQKKYKRDGQCQIVHNGVMHKDLKPITDVVLERRLLSLECVLVFSTIRHSRRQIGQRNREGWKHIAIATEENTVKIKVKNIAQNNKNKTMQMMFADLKTKCCDMNKSSFKCSAFY